MFSKSPVSISLIIVLLVHHVLADVAMLPILSPSNAMVATVKNLRNAAQKTKRDNGTRFALKDDETLYWGLPSELNSWIVVFLNDVPW